VMHVPEESHTRMRCESRVRKQLVGGRGCYNVFEILCVLLVVNLGAGGGVG
jgi:hypothetical protein